LSIREAQNQFGDPEAVPMTSGSRRFFPALLAGIMGGALLVPSVAFCNPIDPSAPFLPPTLVAVLLEVIAVMLLIRRAVPRIKEGRFLLWWYAVNLVSLYGVFRPIWLQMGLSALLAEAVAVLLEGGLLFWSVNKGWFGPCEHSRFTWRRALVVAVIGNLVSVLAFVPIRAVWPDFLYPEIYKPLRVE
jgi:hypothetical protein